MFFLMGVTEDRKELEHDQMIVCDECESYGRFIVYMTCMVLTLFFLPVFKWNRRYYVETSCCHRLYELDPEIGRRIERGEKLEIRNSDLTLLSGHRFGNTHKKCAYCGYETEEDFAYCPKCGNRF